MPDAIEVSVIFQIVRIHQTEYGADISEISLQSPGESAVWLQSTTTTTFQSQWL